MQPSTAPTVFAHSPAVRQGYFGKEFCSVFLYWIQLTTGVQACQVEALDLVNMTSSFRIFTSLKSATFCYINNSLILFI
jgi:hypothetical protein